MIENISFELDLYLQIFSNYEQKHEGKISFICQKQGYTTFTTNCRFIWPKNKPFWLVISKKGLNGMSDFKIDIPSLNIVILYETSVVRSMLRLYCSWQRSLIFSCNTFSTPIAIIILIQPPIRKRLTDTVPKKSVW